MKVVVTALGWICSVFLILGGFVYFLSPASFVFWIAGILALPIKPIRNLWKKMLGKFPAWLQIPLLLIIFFIGCGLAPVSEDTDTAAEPSQIESSTAPEATTLASTESTATPAASSVPTQTPVKTTAPTVSPSAIPTSTPDATVKPSATPVPAKKATPTQAPTTAPVVTAFSLSDIPAYGSEPYAVVNNNVPYFTDAEMVTNAFENYSSLDSLGRCGVAYANICPEIMPKEERGEIGSIKPSGWHSVKYDNVDGKYLYNRCHLIGFQLAGENANEQNLITGTRYLNMEGMLPFENMVDDYVDETKNHVLYRVTPIFEGDNLVAAGVLMEAKSVEDNGEGILFNVFCYNTQPGITIDYATGDSSSGSAAVSTQAPVKTAAPIVSAPTDAPVVTQAPIDSFSDVIVHITDTGKKYHSAGCSSLSKSDHEVTLDKAKSLGLTPCSKCNPPS